MSTAYPKVSKLILIKFLKGCTVWQEISIYLRFFR